MIAPPVYRSYCFINFLKKILKQPLLFLPQES